jgi:hypothetical protein
MSQAEGRNQPASCSCTPATQQPKGLAWLCVCPAALSEGHKRQCSPHGCALWGNCETHQRLADSRRRRCVCEDL